MRRKLSKSERQQIHNKCNGHCAYCGCELDYKDMQVDHMIPISRGGADELSNMLPACRSCNFGIVRHMGDNVTFYFETMERDEQQ